MRPRTDTALLVQGLSHRTAPVEQREKAAPGELAAGLDSMVVGESEIQGQVRAAWRMRAVGELAGRSWRRSPRAS